MSLRNRKWLAAVLMAVLVITATTGAVYAYLSATGGTVTNTFTPEQDENPTVSVSTNSNDYTVTVNVGKPGYAVFVRAAVVVTWRDGEGNVYAELPQYTVNCGDNWFEQGGFYYYALPVTDNSVSGLTVECSDTLDGYTLHVEVISQTIQALGETDPVYDANGTVIEQPKPAVTDAWGIEVNADGTLKNP